MKLSTIICGEKLEDEVRIIFADLNVTGYTVLSNVCGAGQTGMVSGTGGWTDRNKLFLILLPDERMNPLLAAVRTLHERLVEEHHGREVALKAFVQSCDVVV